MGHYKAEEVSFNGQHFYIGLDVHKKSWSVNIRNCEMSLKSFSMNPSHPEATTSCKVLARRSYPLYIDNQPRDLL